MPHRETNESESKNENSRFSLIKEVNVHTCKPGDLRIPIPPELKKKIDADGDGDSKIYFSWYHEHDVPIISSDSLRQDEYTSTDTVKVLANDTVRPPRTDGQIDYISYAENNDFLYWIATEEMLSDKCVSSAYLASRETLLMILNDSTGDISGEIAELPNYTITNTRQGSASNSQISVFNILTDIFSI